MRNIYLDQLHWIAVARTVHHGGSSEERAIVDFLHASKAAGAARYPLSLGHYIETNKNRDKARQGRLGEVMFELSGGFTLAALPTILRHEIDVALSLRFPGRVEVRPLSLVERGLSNAAGRPISVNLEPVRSAIPTIHFDALNARVQELAHKSILTGNAPFGTVPPLTPESLAPAERFGEHLDEFRQRFVGFDAATCERALYAMSMNDIWDELVLVLDRAQIRIEEFAALGIEGYTQFIDAMPSRRVDVHLHREWLAHPELEPDPKHTDLVDWTYVATAAMYCDVVVTERRLGHLLNRPSLEKRAVVITELKNLLVV